jgi:hypothetical protein
MWVLDAYGRTYEQRMAARAPYERWRRTVQSASAVLSDALERDRIARRLIDSCDWKEPTE